MSSPERYSTTMGREQDLEIMYPVHKEEAARRLGLKNHVSLYRFLHRIGRLDLWWRLEGTGEPGGGRPT